MNEKIFDLKLVTRKDDTIQEIEEGKEAENLKIEIIPISAQVAGKFLTANMIEDTDKKMQELKSIFEKFEDINGKEYSYNLDDIYEFCFSRHINKG